MAANPIPEAVLIEAARHGVKPAPCDGEEPLWEFTQTGLLSFVAALTAAQKQGQLDVGSPRTPEQIAATVAWVQSLADSDIAPQPTQQDGGEVVARGFYDPMTGAYSESQHTPRWLPAVVCTAPPSAPVGVEGVRALPGEQVTMTWAQYAELRALAQQPAAGSVDGLMPCPFCGGKAQLAEVEPSGYVVECLYGPCRASTNIRYSCGDDARPLVVEQWNRRAAQQPAAGSVEEPDVALLISMATCLNHGFGLLDAERQKAMLHDMRKVWAEVVGLGYYSPENRERYLATQHQEPTA